MQLKHEHGWWYVYSDTGELMYASQSKEAVEQYMDHEDQRAEGEE